MKSQTTDGINYILVGCSVQFLGIDDTIQSDDFIRDLIESGDEGGFNTVYKSDNWNGLAWHKVETEIPEWIGLTYTEYMQSVFGNTYKPKQEDLLHEIIRIQQGD